MNSDHATQPLPAIDTEPMPPKPTLASLIVAKLQEAAYWVERLDVNMDGQRDTLRETRTLAIVAIGIASLSVLLTITLIVLVAWLVGHVR